MTEPYFKPWIGENYRLSKPRVLILGESHYGNGQEPQTFTQDVIKDWALGERGNRRFFTIVAKILSEKPYTWMDIDSKRIFWQSVAFYNYVQSIVGETSRVRPSEEMWVNSQKALEYTLEDLAPNIVIVLGKEL